STETVLPFVFKLVQSAQNRWLRIRGFNQLGEVIKGVQFQDGVKVVTGELAIADDGRKKVA
ncbi:MAG: hypothetical protein WBA76_08365, partial [Phormidesmis sp.]